MRALTHAVLVLGILGPIILFLPFCKGAVRTGTVAAFAAFLFGIVASLEVGNFPLVSIAGLVLFLPGRAWDRLGVPVPALAEERLGRGLHADQVLCAAILGLGLWSNLGSVWPSVGMPAWMRAALERAGLSQDWSMYIDLREPNGWFRILGVRAGGGVEPLLTDGAPVREPRSFGGMRWHAYMAAVSHRPELRWWLVRSLCGDGGTAAGGRYEAIEVHFDCVHFCEGGADLPRPNAVESYRCDEVLIRSQP
jgi:hypothetical protein